MGSARIENDVRRSFYGDATLHVRSNGSIKTPATDQPYEATSLSTPISRALRASTFSRSVSERAASPSNWRKRESTSPASTFRLLAMALSR
jgi:hypothetical protein